MLGSIKNKFLYPNFTVTRMRYRGPIESYKQNKFISDTVYNINILSKKMIETNDRLKQHIEETHQLTESKIKICKNDEVLFESKLLNNEILNNKITDAISGGIV